MHFAGYCGNTIHVRWASLQFSDGAPNMGGDVFQTQCRPYVEQHVRIAERLHSPGGVFANLVLVVFSAAIHYF